MYTIREESLHRHHVWNTSEWDSVHLISLLAELFYPTSDIDTFMYTVYIHIILWPFSTLAGISLGFLMAVLQIIQSSALHLLNPFSLRSSLITSPRPTLTSTTLNSHAYKPLNAAALLHSFQVSNHFNLPLQTAFPIGSISNQFLSSARVFLSFCSTLSSTKPFAFQFVQVCFHHLC